jgi:hypothetical protein
MAYAMSVSILNIIDLDAPDLPSNDKDIYEVMLERMLADLVESRVEAFESAAPMAVASAEAVEPANEEPTPGATAARQLTPGQAGVTKGPEPLTTPEAAKEDLGEPATGAESTLAMSSIDG